MATDINFLPEVVESEVKKGVYKRKVNVLALISLLVVGAILIAFFAYQLSLSLLLNTTNSRIEKNLDKIKGQINKEINHRALVAKLNIAHDFYNSRNNFSDGVDKLRTIVTDSGATLKMADFNKEGIMKITLEANNSDIFNKLVTSITDTSLKNIFNNIQIVSLTKSEIDKPYSFTIDFKYQNNKKLENVSKENGDEE